MTFSILSPSGDQLSSSLTTFSPPRLVGVAFVLGAVVGPIEARHGKRPKFPSRRAAAREHSSELTCPSQGPRPRGWWQRAELAGVGLEAAWRRGPSATSRLKGRCIFQEPGLKPRLRPHTPASSEPSGAAASRQKGLVWNMSSQELLPSSQIKGGAHPPRVGVSSTSEGKPATIIN